jgi:hypothetical protein
MVAMVNALIKLAEDNGQTPEYLADNVSGILNWIVKENKARNALATVLGGGQDGEDRAAAVELGKRVFSGLRGPVSRYCDFMDAADPEALKARDAIDLNKDTFKAVLLPYDDYDRYVDDFWLGYTPGSGDPLTRPAFEAQIAKQEAERFGGVFLPEPGTGKTILQQWNEGHGDNFIHPTREVKLRDCSSECIRQRGHRYDHD